MGGSRGAPDPAGRGEIIDVLIRHNRKGKYRIFIEIKYFRSMLPPRRGEIVDVLVRHNKKGKYQILKGYQLISLDAMYLLGEAPQLLPAPGCSPAARNPDKWERLCCLVGRHSNISMDSHVHKYI